MQKFFQLLFFICTFLHGYSQSTKYNKSYGIACHNCYDPHLATNIEDVFPYTTTIEIDIWDNFQGSGLLSAGDKMTGDWYVKHDFWQEGNVNCCGGSFGDCLKRIKTWSDKNPTHDVVTIFIDKKENWSDPNETRKPIDFDNLIVSIFSKNSIYTPSDLLGDKKNLKEAALTNWATMDSLKGKFIFVITDATDITTRKPLNEYLEAQKNKAICFVAPQISSADKINQPDGFTAENAQNVVFYNLEYPSNLSESIASLNCLSRIFGSAETIDSYNNLISKKINFIALKNYKLKE